MPAVARLAFLLLLVLLAGACDRQTEPARVSLPLAGTLGDPINGNLRPFYGGLRDLGCVEGQNLVIERRYGEGRPERIPEMATDLAREVISARGRASRGRGR